MRVRKWTQNFHFCMTYNIKWLFTLMLSFVANVVPVFSKKQMEASCLLCKPEKKQRQHTLPHINKNRNSGIQTENIIPPRACPPDPVPGEDLSLGLEGFVNQWLPVMRLRLSPYILPEELWALMLFFQFVQHYDTASFMHVFFRLKTNLFRNEIRTVAISKCVCVSGLSVSERNGLQESSAGH